MIAVLPLMIAGTALASYYSIDATVSVSVFVDEESVLQDVAYAKVVFKDKSEEEHTITKGHQSKVNLKAVSNGYAFKGWYAGDKAAYELDLTDGTVEFAFETEAISVGMTDYEKLMAVYDINKFDVSYSYKANPNDASDIYTTPETDDGTATQRIYNYGDLFQVLDYEGEDFRFAGWKIVGDETETIYTSATFETTEPITLTAVWQEQNEINVNYYLSIADQDSLKTVSIYENQLYTLEDAEGIVPEGTIKNGYRYAWQDKDGRELQTVSSTSNIDVYLKTEEIVYTATLDFSKADNTTFEKENEVRFTIENFNNINDWFVAENWKTEYTFHNFAGLEFAGTTYRTSAEIENLVNAIVDQNPKGLDAPVELAVIVNKNLKNFNVSNGIVFKAAVDGSSSYLENVYKQSDLPTQPDFSDGAPMVLATRKIASTSTVYELLNMGANGEIKLYTKKGNEVALSALSITINGKTITIIIKDAMTLNDMIQQIINGGLITGIDATAETFEVTSMVAYFDEIV